MKNLICFIAGVLLACCLTGCQKAQPVAEEPGPEVVEPVPNALTIQLAGESKTLVYPLLSVFQFGSLYVDRETGRPGGTMNYRFYQEVFSEFPRDTDPVIAVGGIEFDDVEYTDPGQWITQILMWELDSPRLKGIHIIPLEMGQYNGGHEKIADVKIESFRPGNMLMVITTTAGDIITLNYTDKILHDDRYL